MIQQYIYIHRNDELLFFTMLKYIFIVVPKPPKKHSSSAPR